MTDDPRDILNRVLALLADLDRIMAPHRRREGAPYRVELAPPPPLPRAEAALPEGRRATAPTRGIESWRSVPLARDQRPTVPPTPWIEPPADATGPVTTSGAGATPDDDDEPPPAGSRRAPKAPAASGPSDRPDRPAGARAAAAPSVAPVRSDSKAADQDRRETPPVAALRPPRPAAPSATTPPRTESPSAQTRSLIRPSLPPTAPVAARSAPPFTPPRAPIPDAVGPTDTQLGAAADQVLPPAPDDGGMDADPSMPPFDDMPPIDDAGSVSRAAGRSLFFRGRRVTALNRAEAAAVERRLGVAFLDRALRRLG